MRSRDRYRKHKRTLDFFGHVFQARKVEGFLLFEQLHRNEAVGLHAGLWQVFLCTQRFVIPQDAVVRKGEWLPADCASERVVVLIELLIALSSHTGVSHDDVNPLRHAQPQFTGGQRSFENTQPPRKVVGNAGRIRAAYLAFADEHIEQTASLSGGQRLFVINQSEYTAHQQTPSVSISLTGSLTYKRRSFRY